jgi:hypothetical protein
MEGGGIFDKLGKAIADNADDAAELLAVQGLLPRNTQGLTSLLYAKPDNLRFLNIDAYRKNISGVKQIREKSVGTRSESEVNKLNQADNFRKDYLKHMQSRTIVQGIPLVAITIVVCIVMILIFYYSGDGALKIAGVIGFGAFVTGLYAFSIYMAKHSGTVRWRTAENAMEFADLLD